MSLSKSSAGLSEAQDSQVVALLKQQIKLLEDNNTYLEYIAEKAGSAEMRQCQSSGEATDASSTTEA
eukprot:4049327-Pyramimonas_sp.AAC.1